MRLKPMQTSLMCAFLLLVAILLLDVLFADSFVGYLGYLLTPGIWAVYDNFDVNNHDLIPLVAALLLDMLLYWAVFALAIGLSRKTARANVEHEGRS